MATKHDLENLLNGELAKLLSDAGIPAEAEVKQGKWRLDILADVDGLRVVLEAETGFGKRSEAIKDADARLKQNLTVMAFAVCYPDGAHVDDLADANVQWTLRTQAGANWTESEWSQGTIPDLATAIKQAPANFDDVDGAAKILSQGLDTGAQRLSTPQRRALAKALNLPDLKTKTKKSDGYFTAAKRGLLVVATAMLFHHRVLEHLPQSRPDQWHGEWPPKTATACSLHHTTTILDFDHAWEAILAVDYRPVFATAREALAALPATADAGQLVQGLAKVVEQVARMVSEMRHDLLGRIFHRVLDTARYDGSFYTSTAAATLLANLAIRQGDRDWSDADAISEMRICDPACGTGTLLMAAARRIHDLREREGKGDLDDETLLAEALVEDVLWGYDINVSATHMAASALGMLSPKTQARDFNIVETTLGVKDGQVHLGSIALLQAMPRLMGEGSARQIEENIGMPDKVPEPMDLVIMNPPFTRDSLRHDQFTRKEEQTIKRAEKRLLDGQPYRRAARLHSSGGMFTVLAERMLKSNRGTSALILPSVVPTAPGNLELRKFLAERFHIETIISTHDPQRIFMSENTKIGESLFICRRWESDQPKPPTRFINLARNPSTAYEALALLQRLEPGRSTKEFTIQLVDSKRVERGDWFATNFFAPYLVSEFSKLADGEVLPGTDMSLNRLDKLADVGPAGQRIRDAFTKTEVATEGGRRALWQYEGDSTFSMQASTDWYIEPKPAKSHLADRYWENRSHFLLPAKWRLNTGSLSAVRVESRAVGSLWVPFTPTEHYDPMGKALCTWLNSSIGVLLVLGGRTNEVLRRPEFSLEAQRSFRVPDFRSHEDARENLAAAFEELKSETLQPLSKLMQDKVRETIDRKVIDALGLDGEWVRRIRRALSEEPALTGRRYGN